MRVPGSSPFSQLNLHETDEVKVVSKKNSQFQRKNELIKQIQTNYPPGLNESKTRRSFRSQVIDGAQEIRRNWRRVVIGCIPVTRVPSRRKERRTDDITCRYQQLYHENLAKIRPVKRVTPFFFLGAAWVSPISQRSEEILRPVYHMIATNRLTMQGLAQKREEVGQRKLNGGRGPPGNTLDQRQKILWGVPWDGEEKKRK